MEEKYCFLRSVPGNYADEQRKIILKTEPLKAYIHRKGFDAVLALKSLIFAEMLY